MTKMFLLGNTDKKRRGLILAGVNNSGKSTIARYISNIFDSHVLNQTEGIFAEKITKIDSNKQILVIDEVNSSIFAKRKMADTKLLLEGYGMSIQNKFEDPYKGFMRCYTLITTNHLPYPFNPPANTYSGISNEEW
jgi:phage/plasmid-associated DNA primase